MNNTFLNEDILLKVEKPARYIGNEPNMCVKNPDNVEIRIGLCFPDVYEIGMSNIGIQIIYELFNRREDTYCERVFSPWHDLDKIMREKSIPLFTLESQSPVRDMNMLGFSMGYEMCYTNVLQVLDLSGIPLYSKDRSEDDPIIFGGGTCTYNPEPIADFFDFLYIGEAETRYDEVLDLYKKYRHDKRRFLREVSHVDGIYVPSLYSVQYNQDGTIKSFTPKYEDVPSIIKRQVVTDMDSVRFIDKPIVPFIKVTQDRVVLEIMRGCIRGCRFCQAGMIYRPLREHSLEYLKDYAVKMLELTGADEISLSSLSSSDFSRIEELLAFLIDYTSVKKINISLPSLRIDSFSLDVMNKVQDVKKSSLTFAAEAGTQRLRDVINKGITENDILSGSLDAFRGGWNKVKMYFMLGLPTETAEDRDGIGDLCEKIAETYFSIPKEQRVGKVQIQASSSFFVPKPFTPFQWASMFSADEYKNMAGQVKDHIREQLNQKCIKYAWHDPDVSVLEGVFARGDRKLSELIETAYHLGCMYDAWSDSFRPDLWEKAFEICGLSPAFYNRERKLDEILPWDFIDIGVKKEFLIREWNNALNGVITPNCRQQCSGCGARMFEGGVCFENKN
ncbi:MAG: TIGR03960 family B12-binding radical SAM protein [Lachnospiraceae bacterium]|nr:TIGR03960 family B12-binding radical SAM protein [Candidatus Darwinimomas equi]